VRRAATAAFIVGESVLVRAVGLLLCSVLGGVYAQVLVPVLTGVFDPPSDALAVPWGLLAGWSCRSGSAPS
jgi:putative ABC transport system permease protein